MSDLPLPLLIDACVLFPRIPRGLTLMAAEAGLIRPYWSERILEEWRLSALRRGGDDREARRIIDRMTGRWPDALLEPDRAVELSVHLPDPGDAHVVATAVGRVPEILTFNLRDFPKRTLAGLGLAARHPDEVFWFLQSVAPGPMTASVRSLAEELGADDPADIRRLLKRSLLPRLGKAVEADGQTFTRP
ncbi:MAG: PIN domain-containing protein [Pseudomonadota bacterium]